VIWRAASGTEIQDVVATGPTDAWASGQTFKNGRGRPLLLHWDGHGWRPFPGPSDDDLDIERYLSLEATSPRDVWVVGFNDTGFSGNSQISHWDGTQWTSFPKAIGIQTWLQVLRPDQAWAVERTNVFSTKSRLRRYDGKSWKTIPAPPALSQIGVLKADDIWGVTLIEDPDDQRIRRNKVMHWDGHRWTTVHLPAIKPPKRPFPQLGTVRPWVHEIRVLGPKNVWAVAGFEVGGGDRLPGTVLLHWTGRSWHQTRLPGIYAGGLRPDGNGGLWAAATRAKVTLVDGDRPANQYLGLESLHWTAGRLDRRPVPAPRSTEWFDIAPVPGSSSPLAFWSTSSRPSTSVVYRYR
jgi:hypothetical protein